jgi:hypothetical protein
MRYGVSLLLRVALRIRFPSVLLQPLGHLSVFRINNLRAAVELIIAHAGNDAGVEFDPVCIQRFGADRREASRSIV